MFFYLQSYLVEFYSGFNLVRYITFRAVACAVTSFLISVILGPRIIRGLKKLQMTDDKDASDLNKRRDELITEKRAPLEFKAYADLTRSMKKGVPSIGGIIIGVAVLVSTLLWSDLGNRFVLTAVSVFAALALVGLYDDLAKLRLKSRGVAGRYKLIWQTAVGLSAGFVLYYGGMNAAALWNVEVAGGNYRPFIDQGLSTVLTVPFFKDVFLRLGWVYPFFAALVIVGASNAVNLTDGLDGLASGSMVFVALVYTAFAYVTGNWHLSSYLGFLFIEGSGELSVFCAAIAGASLGFLWFNSYPAQVFMGDTGSLALGGGIGAVALIVKQEILLILAGGIFVAEALSVIIQVLSFKIWKKRPFKIAPLHHHFECNGLFEPKIIMRFLIVGAILALVSLGTLKIR